MADEFTDGRGRPVGVRPGSAGGRRWNELFAETPNYRALGKALSGGEEFRWHFGPMFYRGRLRTARCKVLVIGQEGAQDESLGPPLVHRRHRWRACSIS